jgi:hypothetical protein
MEATTGVYCIFTDLALDTDLLLDFVDFGIDLGGRVLSFKGENKLDKAEEGVAIGLTHSCGDLRRVQ